MLEDRRLRVAVIEDSPAFMLRLVHALNANPLLNLIGSAETAHEGIELLGHSQADLVLLDLYLKQGSGIDVLRHIRKQKWDLRTIVMTSEQSDEVRSACTDLGAYRFCDKTELLFVLDGEAEQLAKTLLRT